MSEAVESLSGDDLVIVAGRRTPFTKFGGTLRDWKLAELAAPAIDAALADARIAGTDVGELVLGVNLPGSDRSVARQAALHAGLGVESVAYTVDRACCSSLAALTFAERAVSTGAASVAVAGGAENMSRVPYFLEGMRWGTRLGDVHLDDQLVISCPYTGVPRAVQASTEAAQWGIGRAEQDEWALRSQQRYATAAERDAFADEIVPVTLADGQLLSADEGARPTTTLERLGALPTVNGSATVTAGNAPGMSTGASALAVTTRAEASRRGATPLATLLGTAAVSGHPDKIASIPAVAARAVLDRTGLKLDEIDAVEINEAFAAVPLVATEVLADNDTTRRERLRERTNVNGGAVAIGHPTGATAARMVMTLAYELRRRGGGRGLVTLCGGIGEAHAAVIEVPG